jgi:hypothetical protein
MLVENSKFFDVVNRYIDLTSFIHLTVDTVLNPDSDKYYPDRIGYHLFVCFHGSHVDIRDMTVDEASKAPFIACAIMDLVELLKV